MKLEEGNKEMILEGGGLLHLVGKTQSLRVKGILITSRTTMPWILLGGSSLITSSKTLKETNLTRSN